jgi:hypothetical protein
VIEISAHVLEAGCSRLEARKTMRKSEDF